MRVRIKICGVTNQIGADLAVSLGADAIGLNAYAQSPRYIDAPKAFAIVRRLPLFVQPVVVIVNEPITSVEEAARKYCAHYIQFHTDRHDYVPGMEYKRWIPAFPISDAASLSTILS